MTLIFTILFLFILSVFTWYFIASLISGPVKPVDDGEVLRQSSETIRDRFAEDIAEQMESYRGN